MHGRAPSGSVSILLRLGSQDKTGEGASKSRGSTEEEFCSWRSATALICAAAAGALAWCNAQGDRIAAETLDLSVKGFEPISVSGSSLRNAGRSPIQDSFL